MWGKGRKVGMRSRVKMFDENIHQFFRGLGVGNSSMSIKGI
jgi:hypothetical protein